MILSSGQHTSLMHGWIPLTVQLVAVLALALALGWPPRRWLTALPPMGLLALAAAGGAYWFVADDGLSGEPAPPEL